jgi:porphobilinogen synthase
MWLWANFTMKSTLLAGQFPSTRLRRLRQHPKLRALVRETRLAVDDFVLPLFIHHGKNVRNPINTMPGHYQLSVDQLADEIKEIVRLKIPGIILFGIPAKKDGVGSESYDAEGVVQRAIRTIKQLAPELLVIADTCFCEYTDHVHCGYLNAKEDVDNDKTLELLVKQAIAQATAGADMIAPSGMIDGMVKHIRAGLDEAGFTEIPILSYAVKYCSSLYAPFGKAAEGAPQFGDRSTLQMDVANSAEALREASLDLQEGADMLMVKPASFYLDVIYRVKTTFPEVPLAAYHVSAEYAMIKAAAERGWINERKVAMEALTGIKRAGANFIITYYAKEVAAWLQEQ